MLGVKAVIAESYERIHRSNLVGMGVLPLQFVDGQSRLNLNLSGEQTLNIIGLEGELSPKRTLSIEVMQEGKPTQTFDVVCRIDTLNEIGYFKAGGILHSVLRDLLASE